MKKNKFKNKSLIAKILCGSFALVGTLCLFIFGGAKTYAYELNEDGDLISQNISNISASVVTALPSEAASDVLINEGAESFNYQNYVILPTTYNNISLDPAVAIFNNNIPSVVNLDLNNSHYETVTSISSTSDQLFQLYSLNMENQIMVGCQVGVDYSSGYSGPVAISFDYTLIRFSYNDVARYGYSFYNIMVSETSYNLPYEVPGAVYYSSQESSGSYQDGYDQGYESGYNNGFVDGSTDSTLYNFLNGSYGTLFYNHDSSDVVGDHANISNGATEASLSIYEDVYSYCYNAFALEGGFHLHISLNEEKTLPFTVNFFNLLSANAVSLLDSNGRLLQRYDLNDAGYCFVNPDGVLSYKYIVINGISLPDTNHERGFFRISVGLNTISYMNGYNQGFKMGELNDEGALNNAYEKGYDSGFAVGKENGYSQAINEGINDNGFKTLFGTVLSYPVNMIRNAFDFEIFGLNVSSLLMFIASIAIVGFIIKKFWK